MIKRSHVLTALTILYFSILTLNATPPYKDPNQPYDRVPGTFETAHIKWASPLSGGKLNVLFIVPYRTSRNVVELAQRLDMDYTIIMSAGTETWDQGAYEGSNATPLKGIEAKNVLEMLMKKRLNLANKYDAIILGSMSWPALPEVARELILKHVERGTALVYVSPRRIERKEYRGYTLISGGKKVTAENPLFSKLFQDNSIPSASSKILSSLPMNSLPLKVLGNAGEFKKLKPLPTVYSPGFFRQYPVCITSSQYGKGRVLTLDYFSSGLRRALKTVLIPQVPYTKVTHDYLYALLAKCIIWSTGKIDNTELKIEVNSPATDLKAPVDPDEAKKQWEIKTPVTVARKDLDQTKFILKIQFPKKQKVSGSLNWFLQDQKGTILKQGNISVKTDNDNKFVTSIKAPKLARGTYFIGLRLLNEAQDVVDFSSKSFRVEDPLRITKILTDKQFYKPDETVHAKITFNQPIEAGQHVIAKVIDNWGRVIKQQAVDNTSGKTSVDFKFSVKYPMSRLWDIVCEVSDNSGVIDSAKTTIGIPDNRIREFMLSQWLGPIPDIGFKGRCLTDSMHRFGQNAGVSELIYHYTYQFELFERYGLRNVYFAEHLGQRDCEPKWKGSSNLNEEFSGGCLSQFSQMARYIADTGNLPDPKEFPYNDNKKWGWMNAKWFQNSVKDRYTASAKFGGVFYIINSENTLCGESSSRENTCFCPLCTKRFQEWCKKIYKNDIDQLNTEWNSSFKDFSEVRGIMLQAAVEKNQLPRWVDFRHFMRSQVFTQFHIDWTDMIRRFSPDAKTAMGALCNFDFTRLRNHLTCCSCNVATDMGSVQSELLQSFSGDKSIILGEGNTLRWEPEYKTPLDNIRYPWKYLLLGYKGLKIGMEQNRNNVLGGYNYMTADYSEPLPFFKRISEEVRILQKGVGALIMTAKPVRSKVAILWSPYNHYISRLFPFQDNGFSGGSHVNVSVNGGAIEDCLMLMQSLRIRSTFIGPQDVEAGELEARGFKALFLPYNKGVSKAEAEAITRFVQNGGLVIADNEPGICSEHGRILKDARLKHLFPVTDKKYLHKLGKGATLYLAGELNGYAARLLRRNYTGSDSVAVALKEKAGEVPELELIDEKGIPLRDCLMSLFRQGSTTIAGLLRQKTGDAEEACAVSMKLPKSCHVWDIRAKRYLGFSDQYKINLSLEPKCYALLTSNPESMQIKPDKGVVKQGYPVVLKGKIKFDDTQNHDSIGQAVSITVFAPDNSKKACYSKNVVFSGDSFELILPVSFSEKTGRYSIVAEHAITGMKAETNFDVTGE